MRILIALLFLILIPATALAQSVYHGDGSTVQVPVLYKLPTHYAAVAGGCDPDTTRALPAGAITQLAIDVREVGGSWFRARIVNPASATPDAAGWRVAWLSFGRSANWECRAVAWADTAISCPDPALQFRTELSPAPPPDPDHFTPAPPTHRMGTPNGG